MISWYSASRSAIDTVPSSQFPVPSSKLDVVRHSEPGTRNSELVTRPSVFLLREPLQRQPLQPFPDGVDLDRLDHVCRERVGQELPSELGTHPTALHVKQRHLIESPYRRAVRALDVVGKDLELRLDIDLRLLGQKE